MNQMMKVVFVSNFMNHHQLPVALEMNKIYDYKFIATEPIAQEQLNMKYEDMNKKYDFIVRTYDNSSNPNYVKELIDNADVVIFGSCPFELVEDRIESNKLTFRYSERLFKEKTFVRKFHPIMWKKYYTQCTKYKNKNHYLLCASAYSAKDYAWFGAFKNKTFKWGYFPEVEQIDVDEIFDLRKAEEKLNIAWCNRLVKYKHPEMSIMAAKELKKNNIKFEMTIVGVGPLSDKIRNLINKNGLTNEVKMIGSVPSNEVRKILKRADIALLTADKGEGWGAVVNESMNSACAILCNKYTGSVPYLVKDNFSGLIYKNKSQFLSKLLTLAKDKVLRYKLGKNAYETLSSVWSPEMAVKNFDKLTKALLNNEQALIQEGPCSKG